MIDSRLEAMTQHAIATVVLVKPANEPAEEASGKLLLFDPGAKTVVEVASHVTRVHVSSFSQGKLSLLYERDKRLILDTFDRRSIAKLQDQEIEIPPLK